MSGVSAVPQSTVRTELDIQQSALPRNGQSQPANDNSVSQSHAPDPRPAGSSDPNAGARDATIKPPTRKEIEALTEERLMEDPEYRELKEMLDSCEGLTDMFFLIDKTVGTTGNGIVTMSDIIALVNDTNQPNKAAREAAKWLNDHREILNTLLKGDEFIGAHDVKSFLDGKKAELKAMKAAARAEIKEEVGVSANAATGKTPDSGGTAASDQSTANQAIMSEAGDALPKPPPSQFGGLEGASENLNNMVGWAEAETDRLTTLMGKTDDPAVLKQLETKINQMSRRMQQMTALMNQIMNAMQNISKMYSDIAMNSVRNMK